MSMGVGQGVDNARAMTLRTFENFVGGSDKVSDGTVVCLSSGETRKIVPAKFDSVGNVGRLKAARDGNDDVRAAFKAAVAAKFGGEDQIPDSVKTAMKFQDYGKGKPLTARRIRTTLAAIDKYEKGVRAAENKAVDHLTGQDIRGSVSRDTSTKIVGELLKGLENCTLMSKDDQGKVTKFIDRMIKAGANPNKIVRMAYALTQGLQKLGEALFAADSGVSDFPKTKPMKPMKPWTFLCSEEEAAKKNAAYEQELADYKRQNALFEQACNVVKGFFDGFAHEIEKVIGDGSAEGGSGKPDASICDSFADCILVKTRLLSEESHPGVFDKTMGAAMDDLDSRLQTHISKKLAEDPTLKDYVFLEKKSQSEKPLATFKVDVGSFFDDKIKDLLRSKLEGLFSFGGMSLTQGKDNSTLKLSFSDLKLGESVPAYGGKSIKDLAVSLRFSVDSNTGKLSVTVGNMESESSREFVESVGYFLKGQIRSMMQSEIAAALGANVSVRNDGLLNKIEELSDNGSAPVEVDRPDGDDIISLTIDPSRFGPLKGFGFDADTRFGGVKIEGGSMVVQVGGKTDEIDSTELPGAGQIGTHIHFGGLADRMGHVLRNSGVKFGEMKIGSENGKVSVSLRDFDATALVKDVKGLKGKALRIFAKGSFKLSFTPKFDPETGKITFAFSGLESLGGAKNRMKKNLINAFMRTIAENALAGNQDIQVEKDKDPDAVLTLSMSVKKNLPQIAGMDMTAQPVEIKVTDQGLAIGVGITAGDGNAK